MPSNTIIRILCCNHNMSTELDTCVLNKRCLFRKFVIINLGFVMLMVCVVNTQLPTAKPGHSNRKTMTVKGFSFVQW